MKNINSKKARNEIGDLIGYLEMYTELTNTADGVNFRYFWARKCDCIVQLQEVYGIPSNYYEQAKETLASPLYAEATRTKEV